MNVGDVKGGWVHNDDVSSDDGEDESFNYDSTLEILFDDDSDVNDDFVEEKVGNLIDYDHDQDGTRKENKNKSGKWTKSV